jgi:hypothetical protein
LEDDKVHTLQQDGAPPHHSYSDTLIDNVPGHWMGRRCPLSWHLKPPDSTPLNFVLWILLKRAVYMSTRQTADFNELKQQIPTVAVSATPEMLRHVWTEIIYCLDICHAIKGEHLEIY